MNALALLYRLALRFYPRRFADAYADEMRALFSQRLADSGRAAFVLRELRDLPASILREHLYALRSTNAGLNPSLEAATPTGSVSLGTPEPARNASGWVALLTGLLPFLWGPLFGLVGWLLHIIWKSPPGGLPIPQNPIYGVVVGNLLALLVLAIMLLLVIAWRRGFPAWSYPLGVQFVLLSLYLTNVTMPGLVVFNHTVDSLPDGFSLRLPLIVAVVGTLASLPRPLDPLRAGWRGLRAKPSRLTFGLAGLTPLLLRIVFDEVHGELPFLIALDVLLALAALFYLRSVRARLQSGAMLGGLLLVWLASAVYLGIYWESGLEIWMATNFRGVLIFGGVVTALTFLPWVIQAIRGWLRTRRVQ